MRRIGAGEVERAHALIAACGRELLARYDLHQWDPPYPLETMRAEALSREIWLVEDDGQPIATYTIGTQPIAPYTRAHFELDRPALYLNRLAVLPSAWQSGVGSFCMREIEQRARALGVEAVRCDTVSAADFLRRFYRRLGYEERGELLLGTLPVTCYEKRLT